MILADTSLWIDHIHRSDPELTSLLEVALLVTHPTVIGELAIGNIPDRDSVLAQLARLRQVRIATDAEVLVTVANHRLHGRGLNYPDAQLIAACLITPQSVLWTRDKTLSQAAHDLGIGWSPTAGSQEFLGRS